MFIKIIIVGVLLILMLFTFFILISRSNQRKKEREVKSNILKHPSTFIKPQIERVDKPKQNNLKDKNLKIISFNNLKEDK